MYGTSTDLDPAPSLPSGPPPALIPRRVWVQADPARQPQAPGGTLGSVSCREGGGCGWAGVRGDGGQVGARALELEESVKARKEIVSGFGETGRQMAKVARQAKAAKKAEEAPVPAPLAPWLTGDKRGLPLKPPGKVGT